MNISVNASVSCSDGPCGKTTLVIIKPASEEITHLVVNNEAFPEIEYIVPIAQVAESTSENIRLSCSLKELSKMPVFDRLEFIPSGPVGLIAGPYMMWPYFYPAVAFEALQNEQIPADELAVRRGARVEATDGHAGHVDEFLMDPENDHITHLIMREGHLWGQKDVTIPISQIDHFADNIVWLKLDKKSIEALPAIPIHHAHDTIKE